MPYLVLILGIIIGLYALYRFFIKASPEQVRNLIHYTIVTLFCLVLIFFALTSRIIISLALLTLSIPFIISHLKGKTKSKKEDNED